MARKKKDDAERKAQSVSWRPNMTGDGNYKTPIFLSYPKPYQARQRDFIEKLCSHLNERDFSPRTLDVTDYNFKAPLHAIRKMMSESYGLITVAFRRTYLRKATGNYRTNIKTLKEYNLDGTWMTSPWAHIEPAMAYQIGLPVMILRESGVIADGILEKGTLGLSMPEFDLSAKAEDYLGTQQWRHLIRQWESDVRGVEARRGEPPSAF
ncbi:hypothetical protein [Kineococcus sp. SYSU DK005]|uniref:hypothetical protein n=1 Tax=Kineococcus sp. SYSU DK005 TaxID=3383126 RepID=UPI003D7C6AB5